MKNSLFVIFAITLVISACGSGGSSTPKDENPELSITFPTESSVILRSTELTFSGMVSDDVELKEIRFSLKYHSGKKSVDDPWQPADDIRQLTGKEKTFSKEPIFDGAVHYESKPGIYTLLVVVKDNAGQTTEKKVNFSIE